MATFDQWMDVYALAYDAIPDRPTMACPNCGHHEVNLVFTAKIDGHTGWASLWCGHCLEGTHLSRVPIPAGAVVRDGNQPLADQLPAVPDYRLVN